MALTLPDREDNQNAAVGTFRAEPPVRQRVADQVFESLARGILNGELKPGEPLATQRDLAKQFNVSALVVRQAIHRLEDLGLVRVRQGSTTIVLDPNESTDIRLIQLRMEVAEPGPMLARAALENQLLFMLPLLVLAERRITEPEVAVLRYLTERLGANPTQEAGIRFRIEYWRQIAKSTQNPLFQAQVRWWSSLIDQLERSGRDMRAPPAPIMLAFCSKLNDALAKHEGAVQLYLETFRPVLDWFDAQRGIGKQVQPTKE
jgi:DNA-binding FadR family transcriptional regulator